MIRSAARPPCHRPSAVAAFILLAVATSLNGAQAPLGTFPFKRDGHLMLVEVRINESAPRWFAVDSGAPHSVFAPKLARELGLKVEPASDITGTGAGKVNRSKTAPAVMSLHGLKVDLPEPWVIDLSTVPIPKTVKGLVGAEIFKNFVVRIDPIDSTLTIFDPASFQYAGEGASLPFTLENDRLFLEAQLEVPTGQTVTHRLRIDTGSDSSVNDEVVKQSAELQTSTLGGGLGKNFKSYSGVFTSVIIGPYAIKHVWGPGGPGPAIGMEILRRFIITFDASRGRMYLEPTPALDDPVPTPPAD